MTDSVPRQGLLVICGSLEPGRDGVGDHVSRLAAELAGRGLPISLLALADAFITEVDARPMNIDGRRLPVLRLPSNQTWTDRLSAARRFVDDQDPALLSLHLVPWSFGTKGITVGLGRRLRRLSGDRPWHVMAHELWLHDRVLRRQNLLGVAQRRALISSLRALSPQRVHVTTTRYADLLASAQIEASILPLFGNLPIASDGAAPAGDGHLQVVAFGTLPEQLQEVVDELSAMARQQPVRLVVAGGDQTSRRRFVSLASSHLASQSAAIDAGFQSAGDASKLIASSDVGIARYDTAHLSKSGVLATLLEHGLPVWAPFWDGRPLDVPFRRHLVHQRLEAAASASREPACSFLPEVTDMLLRDVGEIV